MATQRTARSGNWRALARKTARGLTLTAAPTFAVMASWSALVVDPAAGAICMAGGSGSHGAGMTVMYALMAAFHLGPWLRFASGRASGRRIEFNGSKGEWA